MANDARGHRWRFFRAGGFDQVRLDTRRGSCRARRARPEALGRAVPARSRASSSTRRRSRSSTPTRTAASARPRFSPPSEWAGSRAARDPDDLARRASPALPLAAIDDADATRARRSLASAKHDPRRTSGKPDATEITLDDTTDTARDLRRRRGSTATAIVPPTSADDPTRWRRRSRTSSPASGGERDRSGEPGVDAGEGRRVLRRGAGVRGWWAAAETDAATSCRSATRHGGRGRRAPRRAAPRSTTTSRAAGSRPSTRASPRRSTATRPSTSRSPPRTLGVDAERGRRLPARARRGRAGRCRSPTG